MRFFSRTFAILLTCAAAASYAATPDPAAPKGLLPDAARPSAYRLDLTIDPDQPRFSGHAEIDAALTAPTTRLYLHGRDLHITRVATIVAGRPVATTYTQVDPTGVVRLDFAERLAAGPVTFTFDYDAAFGESPAGLYRINVGGTWYSWTQFESIDARAAFPGFDQPGYKTPFTVSITTKPGNIAVSNAAEAAVTTIKTGAGTLEKHQFATTRPLPTYLVALVTGPFLHPTSTIAPTPQRATPLPLGAVATRAEAGKLDYVLAETPRIVGLLEDYFNQPFPFPKLDQIASPVMPGAMENAGADIYGDDIILLDRGATTRDRQEFGMVVAHELAHQWFGDLVSPAWWEDIWLNESFANWMGYRIGNAWRPELNIGVGAIGEGLAAMNADALEVGRPIHQPITRNSQIDSAFDAITYGKGGQVIAMIAAYMGDAKFRDGVRLHLSRHMYGNATSEQFFQALADAGREPGIVKAMRSFVDQQGVPLVSFRREGDRLIATQKRYAFLGSSPPPLTWTIPLCLRQGIARSCQLLDRTTMPLLPPTGRGALMPNAGGQGYYRFDLAPADWAALIAESPTMSGAEVLAMDDSLWADFRAGTITAATLLTAAKATAANPESNASVDAGQRLMGLRLRGLIGGESVGQYRRLIASLYRSRLESLGFDPAVGAYASDDPDRQKLRQDLVALIAREAQDGAVRARLIAAADAYLAGDKAVLDQAFIAVALGLEVEKGGLPAAKVMLARALASEDQAFRGAAIGAVARTGNDQVADWLLAFDDKRLRATERLQIIAGLASNLETREKTLNWVIANYDALAAGNGIFVGSRLPQLLGVECSVERSAELARVLGPKVAKLGIGELEFKRTIESVRHCGVLRQAKSAELASALKATAG